MLQGDLYTIQSIEHENSIATIMLELNVAHPIFTGHFPGQPVLPGACMLQMLKEIMEQITVQRLQLSNAQQMKFLSIIDPSKNAALQMELTYSFPEKESMNVTASLLSNTTTCFRFQGVFSLIQ